MDVEISPQKGAFDTPAFTKAQPQPDAMRSVAIHLIRHDDMSQCPFWIGLFQKGSLNPHELFDSKNLEEAFARAAKEGLTESTPVMMSDSSQVPARFMYLLPEPGYEIKRRAEWIHNLTETIKAWSSQRIGIYLAPELVSQKMMHELLQQILHESIAATSVTDYYLQTTSHGLNSILNTALKVKSDLENVNTYVFH